MKRLNHVVVSNPEVLGGTPVFYGTRVPVRIFLDSLEAGDSIDLFLYDFPSVSRSQLIELLEALKQELMAVAPV